MRASRRLHPMLWIVALGIGILPTLAARAQVEALNPNPTLPAGPGSSGALEEYHHGSSAGVKMGREIGGRVDGADKNPADVMLREIGGTTRGRRSGRVAIHGGAVRAALKFEGLSRASPRAEQNAVYFGRRGEYEDAIYAPFRGSYREGAARRNPTYRPSSKR
jgi:hypothetical protein